MSSAISRLVSLHFVLLSLREGPAMDVQLEGEGSCCRLPLLLNC